MYEFVASTPEERARVRTLMADVVQYIVDNNLYLIDVDGKPTYWGVWAPDQVEVKCFKCFICQILYSFNIKRQKLSWLLCVITYADDDSAE